MRVLEPDPSDLLPESDPDSCKDVRHDRARIAQGLIALLVALALIGKAVVDQLPSEIKLLDWLFHFFGVPEILVWLSWIARLFWATH
jgi:hypothetical protein